MSASDSSNNNSERTRLYSAVGLKIREFRGKKNWKQEALAEAVGLTRTSLTNIEKGRQGLMLHTFVELARILGVKPLDLLPSESANLDELGIKMRTTKAGDLEFVARAVIPNATNEQNQTNHTRTVIQKRRNGRSR